MPKPSQLIAPGKPRAAAYVDADLQKDGALFDPLLPLNRVAVAGTQATFTPDFSAGSAMTGAAYCTYNFLITGYDRNPQVRLDWATLVGASDIWIALANWDKDYWEWFPGSGEPSLDLPSIDPYLRADGRLLVLVVALGSDQVALNSVRIGSQLPVAALSLSSPSGSIPADVTCDASASGDPDGTIVKYEWDFNNNGQFEFDSGADPAPVHQFNTVGLTPISVRVTDDTGLTSTAQATFTAFEEWIHSWGGGGGDQIQCCAYDGAGGLYMAGPDISFDTGGNAILLLKFDLAGGLVWARVWDTMQDESVSQIAFDSDGNLILTGFADFFTQDLLLQKWSPDGDLLMSRWFNSHSPTFFGNGLVVVGQTAYICGNTGSFINFGLLKYDLAGGGLQFARVWDPGSDNTSIQDMAYFSSSQPGNSSLHAVGNMSSKAFAIRWDEDGTLTNFRQLNVSGSSSANAIDTACSAENQILVGGSLPGSPGAGYVCSLEPASQLQSIWRLDAGDCIISGLCRLKDGGYVLVGNDNGFPGNSAASFLFRFSPAGTLQSSQRLVGVGQGYAADGNAVTMIGGGVFFGGHCDRATGAAFETQPGSAESTPLGWIDLSVTELTASTYTDQDFPGTVIDPTGATLDTGSGDVTFGDALGVVHALP